MIGTEPKHNKFLLRTKTEQIYCPHGKRHLQLTLTVNGTRRICANRQIAPKNSQMHFWLQFDDQPHVSLTIAEVLLTVKAKCHWRLGWEIHSVLALNKKLFCFGYEPIIMYESGGMLCAFFFLVSFHAKCIALANDMNVVMWREYVINAHIIYHDWMEASCIWVNSGIGKMQTNVNDLPHETPKNTLFRTDAASNKNKNYILDRMTRRARFVYMRCTCHRELCWCVCMVWLCQWAILVTLLFIKICVFG